jgi:tetratricopeptide (TPR) repeat protein
MEPDEADLAIAEAHYRSGQYAAAARLVEPLATRNSPSSSSLRVFGLCRLRMGATQEAVDLLARAYRLAPMDPWAQLHYGIGLQAVARYGEAVQLFRGCQSLLPADPAPSLNLASALLGIGDEQGAIRAARKAKLRGATMPQTHYTLGLAYLASKYPQRAADCFRTATRLAPRFGDAWLNLGVAYYRAGEIDRAKQAMREALSVDPDNHAAAANLGSFMRLTGEVEASEALLRDMVARHPGAAAARLNLAADLLQEDRATEALDLLDGPEPDNALIRQHWQLQKILALIKLRRLAEAQAAIAALGAVPPSLQPLLHWRRILLALEQGRSTESQDEALAMETCLDATPGILPEHRIMGHYDLAKFWSRCREPDRAFPHWVTGHRLLSRFQPFSRKTYAEFVDETMTRFDVVRLAGGPRASNSDMAPVFVVGMPRSGTTLTEQILSAHAQVHGAGERAALAATFWELGGASETAMGARRVAAQGRSTLDLSASRYLAELHALDPDANRIIDKMPGNFRYLGLMALLMPGARVIVCDRDPRDVGLSIFTFRFYGVHAYAHDLADLGWYIGQQRRLMAHWTAALPNPIMTLRLNDWVEDFSGTLRRVLQFLSLPYDTACENFHEVRRSVRTVSRTQVQEKVNPRGIGRWREYERHLAPLIEALDESGALKDWAPAATAKRSQTNFGHERTSEERH